MLQKKLLVLAKIIDAVKSNTDKLMVPKLDEDKPDYNFIAYTQSIPDPMKYELAQLVIRNSNVRIRNMLEHGEE